MADKNGKKWYEDGYDQTSDPNVKTNKEIPVTSMGPTSDNTKTVVSKDEAFDMGINPDTLPTEFELKHPNLTGSKATDSNGYIDRDGNVHLNSKYSEARAEKAKADLKAEQEKPVADTWQEKIKKGIASDEDLKTAYDAYKAGTYTPGPKTKEAFAKFEAPEVSKEDVKDAVKDAAKEKMDEVEDAAEEAENAQNEASKENAEKLDKMDSFHIGTNMGETDPTLTPEMQEELDTNKQKVKDSYWTNLLYGNGKGSVKDNADAKAEKEAKYKEFMKDNPSMIKAIFGKNSGLNAGDRLLRLGELLASIGADAFGGAYAGFNGKDIPDHNEGRYEKIYNKALNNQYDRQQKQFEAENDITVEKTRYNEAIKSNAVLKDLPDDIQSTLADSMTTGLSLNEMKDLLKDTPYAGNAEQILDAFNKTRDSFSSVTTQRGNAKDVESKELNIKSQTLSNAITAAKSANELQAQITAIDSNIRELETMKKNLAKADQDSYFEYINSYLGYLKGVTTTSNNQGKNANSGWSASATVNGGIPVIKGSVTGGGNHSWGTTEYNNVAKDVLALANIPTAEKGAKNFKEYQAQYTQSICDSIDAQIEDLTVAREAAKARLAEFEKNVNDGIVKAPHMKQWLVREDGTKIELHPDDSIYATKNELTSTKDDGSDVVQMEQEDPAIVIQRKLGHTGCPINKNFDYYLNKLRG